MICLARVIARKPSVAERCIALDHDVNVRRLVRLHCQFVLKPGPYAVRPSFPAFEIPIYRQLEFPVKWYSYLPEGVR